jgi:crotonobetainyl-CoA:carnitine CoA-transferase CaiB-like acyl-CoA transferase
MILQGLRLLDLTQGRPPGNETGHVLADLGMDVIRIDVAGGSGSAMVGGGSDLAWDSLSRNKRSIAINLRSDEGKQVFYKLVEQSDCVLEGARPGSAKRLGIDYDTLRKHNPKLVYVSMSAFGQEGPYASLGAHDSEVSSMRAAWGMYGDEFVTPGDLGLLVTDFGAGLHSAIGILAGLIGVLKSGEGCFIDISLADAINAFNGTHLQAALRGTTRTSPHHREYGSLLCKDGKYITQANVEPDNWLKFIGAVGVPEIEALPKTPPGPQRQEMIAVLRKAMLERTRDEWFQVLTESGCTCGAAKEIGELVDDPQIKARGMIWELEHPVDGAVRQVGFPIMVDGKQATLRNFAPAQGGDTVAILGELNYDASEIEELVRSGAVARG